MSPELIAILAVGVALSGLALTGQRAIRQELLAMRQELVTRIERVEAGQLELRERMAHLEGLLEGLREAIAHNRVT